MKIRLEEAGDREAIAEVERLAFGRPDEAALVEALRERVRPYLSLVALEETLLVGHVVFTPIEVEGHAFEPAPLGLGPLAVTPARQGAGIGSALARAGLEACRAAGAPFVVVLGNPKYYSRFGFVAASRFGLRYGSTPRLDAFQAQELRAGALAGLAGAVRYAAPFEELT